MLPYWTLLSWIKFSRNESVTWWKSSLIWLLQPLFRTVLGFGVLFLLASTLINLDLFEIYCLSDAQSTVEYAWTLWEACIKPICVFIKLSTLTFHWSFVASGREISLVFVSLIFVFVVAKNFLNWISHCLEFRHNRRLLLFSRGMRQKLTLISLVELQQFHWNKKLFRKSAKHFRKRV